MTLYNFRIAEYFFHKEDQLKINIKLSEYDKIRARGVTKLADIKEKGYGIYLLFQEEDIFAVYLEPSKQRIKITNGKEEGRKISDRIVLKLEDLIDK